MMRGFAVRGLRIVNHPFSKEQIMREGLSIGREQSPIIHVADHIFQRHAFAELDACEHYLTDTRAAILLVGAGLKSVLEQLLKRGFQHLHLLAPESDMPQLRKSLMHPLTMGQVTLHGLNGANFRIGQRFDAVLWLNDDFISHKQRAQRLLLARLNRRLKMDGRLVIGLGETDTSHGCPRWDEMMQHGRELGLGEMTIFPFPVMAGHRALYVYNAFAVKQVSRPFAESG